MPTTEELIVRLDEWLKANRPEYHASLLPGLSDTQLADLEAEFGVTLPNDYKLLYRWRNGQSVDCYESLLFNMFACADQVRESWDSFTRLKEAGAFEEDDWWHREWVPFLESGSGDCRVVDTAGVPIGQIGQVISVCHETSERIIEHASINKWLETMVLLFEGGHWLRESSLDWWSNYRAFVAVNNPGYPVEIGMGYYEGEEPDLNTVPDNPAIDPALDARLRAEAAVIFGKKDEQKAWWQFWRR